MRCNYKTEILLSHPIAVESPEPPGEDLQRKAGQMNRSGTGLTVQKKYFDLPTFIFMATSLCHSLVQLCMWQIRRQIKNGLLSVIQLRYYEYNEAGYPHEGILIFITNISGCKMYNEHFKSYNFISIPRIHLISFTI